MLRVMDPHRLAEARSLAFHQVVAGRLRSQPELLERARRRAAEWLAAGHSPDAMRRWVDLLSGSVESVARFIQLDTEEARELRQSTPFAGALPPRERWALWASVQRAFEGAP